MEQIYRNIPIKTDKVTGMYWARGLDMMSADIDDLKRKIDGFLATQFEHGIQAFVVTSKSSRLVTVTGMSSSVILPDGSTRRRFWVYSEDDDGTRDYGRMLAEDLVLANPKTVGQLAIATDLHKQADALRAEADAVMGRIPRTNTDALAQLLKRKT